MDLLHRSGGHWHIVDYKTNALKGRTPAEVAGVYRLQAAVYCLAALRSGAQAVRMDFVFLEQPAVPVTFEYSVSAAGELEETLDEALAGLRGNQFPRQIGEQCGTCLVQEVCTNMAPRSPDGIQ